MQKKTNARLKFYRFGNFGTELPIFIAHGLFGSARNWSSVANQLSVILSRPIVTFDLRNHGSSFWSKDHSYESMAIDLATLISDFGGKGDLIGHSMGGKAIMSLALQFPELVSRLIVVDIAPVNYPSDQRQNLNAMKSIDVSYMKRRSEVDLELKKLIKNEKHRALFLQNLSRDNNGFLCWTLNIASLFENMDNIMSFPVYLQKYYGPALFIRGGLSDYLSNRRQTEIVKFFPNYELHKVDDCGHWIHSEKPLIFQETVALFLNR